MSKAGGHDDVFGLKPYKHPQFMEPLFKIVYLDTYEEVPGIGSFGSEENAHWYLHRHRDKMINRAIEDTLLT